MLSAYFKTTLAVLFTSYLRFPPVTGFIYRTPRSTVPGWPTLARPSNFIGSFSSELPDTRHHGRYTSAGTRACSETSPFVAPCPPGTESSETFGPTWIRADRLVGDTIANGFTGHGTDPSCRRYR